MVVSISIEEIWWDPLTPSLVKRILSNKTNNDNVVFITLLWEGIPLGVWEDRLLELMKTLEEAIPDTSVILILNSWYKPYALDRKYSVVYLDYFLVRVYQQLLLEKKSLPAEQWDFSNKNFLFLTGKPNKPNRVRLLYKFSKQDLLGNAVWSFFPAGSLYSETRNLLPELNNVEFANFCTNHYRNPDDIEVVNNGEAGLHYSGIPFKTEIYQDALFQVVPETSFTQHIEPWITEKVWLAIINRLPFIVAGQPGIAAKLCSMGFNTFNEVLACLYDEEKDDETRLDLIVKNAQHWSNNLANFKMEVLQSVEQNYLQLINLAEQNIKTLDDTAQKYGYRWMDLVSFTDTVPSQWRDRYKKVKDPSWPDCPTEEDFHTLPEWIQQECINVHGLMPTQQ